MPYFKPHSLPTYHERDGNRTRDNLIKSQVLYRLSYTPVIKNAGPDCMSPVLRKLRGMDSNHRPLGYEPNELPDCSTPRY